MTLTTPAKPPAGADNPVRIARITAGYTASDFAARIGISRPALAAIEDGRTSEPREVVTNGMDHVLNTPAGTMQRMLAEWRARRVNAGPVLTASQRAVLMLPPGELPERFSSFQAWRQQFASTPFGFARLLGINHAFVRNYERGLRSSRGMSETLQQALLTVLKVDPGYLAALTALEPGEVPDAD